MSGLIRNAKVITAAISVATRAGEVIFANDLGEEHNRVLIGKFPDRSVHYIKTHPRITDIHPVS